MILEMDEFFYHPSRLKVDAMTHSNIGVQMNDVINLGTYIVHVNQTFVVDSPQVAAIKWCLNSYSY